MIKRTQRRQLISPRFWEVAGLAALTVLAGLLPFELAAPIFTLGPLSITNVELALYATLLVWSVSRALERRMRWTPVHTAVLVWAAALLVAAAFAPFEREAAVKFALRSLGGCALFFAASDLAATPGRAAPVTLALAAGASLSALAALAEMWLPGSRTVLLLFKTQPAVIGSLVRASGSLPYANTAAMYWEAALPPLLAYGVWRALHRAEAYARWVAAAAALVLIEAIILSASRAGLVVAALTLAALTGIAWRTLPALRAPAAASLLALAVLALVNLAASPLWALRLRTDGDTTWYQAGYRTDSPPLSIAAGQMITVSVGVRNDGALTWPAFGDSPVFLSYHWHDPASDRTIVFEGLRTPLPWDVEPGAEVIVAARVIAPGKPGRYVLQWDMVHEDVIWFSAKGDDTGDLPVQVTPAADRQPLSPLPPPIGRLRQSSPARVDLWGAGLRMWLQTPLLGVGPDNFRHLYGPYLGLKPFDNRIHTNNLYLEMLVNLGLLGVLAFLALMIALARTAQRGWRTMRSPEARGLALGLLVGLAAFFAHGFVDYFFEFTSTYGLFWLSAGMAVGLLTEETHT